MKQKDLEGLLSRAAKGVQVSDKLPVSSTSSSKTRLSSSKHRNIKCEFDGYTFDSIKEMNRYKDLLNLQRSGHIKYLLLQVPFMVIPKQGKVKATRYVADFVYIDYYGKQVVEDVKAFDKKKGEFRLTKDFVMKRKLMLERHDIEIKLV